MIAGSDILRSETQVRLGIFLFCRRRLHSGRIYRFSLSLEDRAFERDGRRLDKLVSDVHSVLSRNGRVGAPIGVIAVLVVRANRLPRSDRRHGGVDRLYLFSAVARPGHSYLSACNHAPIVVTVGLVLTGELLTVSQWAMIATSSVGAPLLVVRTGSMRRFAR